MAKRKAEGAPPPPTVAATLVLVVEFNDGIVDEGDHFHTIEDLLATAQNGGVVSKAFVEYAARDRRIVELVKPVAPPAEDVPDGSGS